MEHSQTIHDMPPGTQGLGVGLIFRPAVGPRGAT
jgi:hypothetical protein